jgi:hypothetical protein
MAAEKWYLMRFPRHVALVGALVIGLSTIGLAPASAAPPSFANLSVTPSTTDLDVSRLAVDYSAGKFVVSAETQNFSPAAGYSFVTYATVGQAPLAGSRDYATYTAIVTPTSTVVYESLTTNGTTGPTTPRAGAITSVTGGTVTLSIPEPVHTFPLFVWASLGDGVSSAVAGIPSAGGTMGFGPISPVLAETTTTTTLNSRSQFLGGTPAIVTVHVTPRNAFSSVEIREGTKTIASGTFNRADVKIQLPATLAYGKHRLVAVTTPSSSNLYGASSSAPFSVTVKSPGVKTNTALSISKRSQHYKGKRVTVRVHVSKKAVGKVRIYDGTKKIKTLKLSKSSAKYKLPAKLAKGKHKLHAEFVPKNIYKFAPSVSKAKTLKVVK